MAHVQTETKVKKSKRANGPVTITYLDNSDKMHKRVPSEVKGIVVTSNKDQKSNTYSINDIPPAVRNQLAAMALAKRADTYIRNTVRKGGDESVVSLANSVFDTLKSGKIYTRAEGSGTVGRPFDIELWMDTIIECSKLKKMPAPTEKKLQDIRAKLESLSPKERRDNTMRWQKDATFELALGNVKSARLRKKIKDSDGEYDAMADMF